MSTQIALPVQVPIDQLLRKRTLGGAIELCVELAGLEPKQLQAILRLDKAQFSRWLSGDEGVRWDKFLAMMDACGNDAPALWMLAARGYDLHSVRKLETAVEAENRSLREENEALRRVLMGAK